MEQVNQLKRQISSRSRKRRKSPKGSFLFKFGKSNLQKRKVRRALEIIMKKQDKIEKKKQDAKEQLEFATKNYQKFMEQLNRVVDLITRTAQSFESQKLYRFFESAIEIYKLAFQHDYLPTTKAQCLNTDRITELMKEHNRKYEEKETYELFQKDFKRSIRNVQRRGVKRYEKRQGGIFNAMFNDIFKALFKKKKVLWVMTG